MSGVQAYPIDLSSLTREMTFMLLLLRAEGGLDKERARSEAESLDWRTFCDFMEYHQTHPVLYPVLKEQLAGEEWVPAETLERIRRLYRNNGLLMLHLAAETSRVCSALAGQGIRSLMLKGPVLAKLLYGDLSGRTSSDLDMLVPKEQLAETEQALVELGYRLHQESGELLNNLERKTHHHSYIHDGKDIEIELHWRLNPDTVSEPAFDELWAGKQRSDLGKEVYTLGNEDLYLYLVLHGTRHGWSCLRWLIDIDRLLALPLDWAVLNNKLRRFKSVHLGGAAVVLTASLLGTKAPAEAAAGERSVRIAQLALTFIRERVVLFPKPERRDVALSFNRYLFASMTGRQKWLYAANKLYPSSKDAHVLPLPRSLHFLYFPLRPVLWFWRQVKRSSV
ncbi:nucleotidyltransferase family protein [Paenibacillus sp. NPDC058071]|uniref:nucleotidyltransferase domain-containing protein n=1 Tax=Paenibacillus sp. NPDC058071 TaxID=3346326 RepID=UPI0036DD59DF